MLPHRRCRSIRGHGVVVEIIAGPHRNRRIARSHARHIMLADTDALTGAFAWKLQEQLAVEAADYLADHPDCDLLVIGAGTIPDPHGAGSRPGHVQVDARDVLRGLVFRREVILHNGLLLDQTGRDDTDFALRFLDHATSVHCLDDTLVAAVLSDLAGSGGPAARQAAFLRPRRFIVPATAPEASKTAALSSG